jgi:hypothetical protein
MHAATLAVPLAVTDAAGSTTNVVVDLAVKPSPRTAAPVRRAKAR